MMTGASFSAILCSFTPVQALTFEKMAVCRLCLHQKPVCMCMYGSQVTLHDLGSPGFYPMFLIFSGMKFWFSCASSLDLCIFLTSQVLSNHEHNNNGTSYNHLACSLSSTLTCAGLFHGSQAGRFDSSFRNDLPYLLSQINGRVLVLREVYIIIT